MVLYHEMYPMTPPLPDPTPYMDTQTIVLSWCWAGTISPSRQVMGYLWNVTNLMMEKLSS